MPAEITNIFLIPADHIRHAWGFYVDGEELCEEGTEAEGVVIQPAANELKTIPPVAVSQYLGASKDVRPTLYVFRAGQRLEWAQ